MSLRLIYAGLFILAGVMSEMFVMQRMCPEINPFEGRIFLPTVAVLVAAAYFLFNERSLWVNRDGKLTYRRRDNLVSEKYQARRALELRDSDNGDGWYLVELDSGKVLCLWDNLPTGPLGCDTANPRIRRFPCTEFTIRRHRVEGYTAEVICAGQLIKPLTVSLPDHYGDWLYAYLPRDGDFVADGNFDEFKTKILEAATSGRIKNLDRSQSA